MWLYILFVVIAGLFVAFLAYPNLLFKVLDIIFNAKDKIDETIHPKKSYTPTRQWECKLIVNKMWQDKEIYFTNKGLDEYNTKMIEVDKALEAHDQQVKMQHMVYTSTADIEVKIFESQIHLAQLGLMFGLLEHPNELVKKPNFVSDAKKALESDISFLENNKTKLSEGDRLCYSFIENLLNICKNPNFRIFEYRYKLLKQKLNEQ